MSFLDAFWDKWPWAKEPNSGPSEEISLLRKCYAISRRGCFSRKRSERKAALAEINRITEKYK
jgi:hypothetical protein